MKRIVFTASLAVALSALVVAHVVANSNQDGKINKIQRRIAVKTLASTRIPVSLTSATARRADNGTVLSYSVTNRANQRLTSLQVVAFIIGSNGAIKGGAGWTLDVDLAENSTEIFSSTLDNKVALGERLAVAVSKATGEFTIFEAYDSELLNAVKSYTGVAASMSHAFKKVNYSSALLPPTFCQSGLTEAKNTCSCGVASYSCNESEQTYSFTCNPPPPGQAACASGPGGN